MLQKCSILFTTVLLSLVLATSAQAIGETYSLLAGSGAQLHIGNGLALPIQPGFAGGGMALPALLIPLKGNVNRPVYQTVAKFPQAKITVPNGVFTKSASQTTVGVFPSNNALYAVGTGLSYAWPAGASGLKTFSTGVRATATVTHVTATSGGSAIYSPGALPKQFGGAAQFALTYPGGLGRFPDLPVTVYAAAIGSAPPCDFNVDANCNALMLGASPAAVGAIGGPIGNIVETPGVAASAIIPIVADPSGNILATGGIGGGPALTNMATSVGYPFTAGKITISQPGASPTEFFILSGTDTRNAAGVGNVQMVAGALSQRLTSGPNANRAWVLLNIGVGDPLVPALSTWGRAAAVGFIALVALGYVKRSGFGATSSA